MSRTCRSTTRISARPLTRSAVALSTALLLAACGGGTTVLSGSGSGSVSAGSAAAGASGDAGSVGVDASGNASVNAADGSGVAASADGDAAVSPGASAGADGGAASAGTAPGGGSFDGSTVVLPEFPVVRVPDVSAVTKKATATRTAISQAVPLPPGVEVTGARCDANGAVVNRTGMTVGGADDGSVVTKAGVTQIGKGGAGQLVGKDVTYQVNADGSGQAVAGAVTVQVNKDGSGQYVDGALVYQVNADGSGSVVGDGSGSYTVNADGSGQWVGAAGPVENAGDGTGTWTAPFGVVTVAGDGTGTVNGSPVKVAPMPKFALLGRLAKLSALGPIGKPCGTLIRISAGVLFDFDKADVRAEARPVLQAVAKALAGTSRTVQVAGHTDSKGADGYNLDLSQRRAKAVVAVLTAAGLTSPVQAQGFGETRPVAPNTLKGQDNPAGRQLNRRVEIVVPD